MIILITQMEKVEKLTYYEKAEIKGRACQSNPL